MMLTPSPAAPPGGGVPLWLPLCCAAELVCEVEPELELGAVEVGFPLPLVLEPEPEAGALPALEAELEGRKGAELEGREVAERAAGVRVSVSEYVCGNDGKEEEADGNGTRG
jgi:hypothetical protein